MARNSSPPQRIGHVRAAQSVRQGLAHHPQHRIPGPVTVRVVDVLEVVDVDEDEPKRVARRRRAASSRDSSWASP